MLKLTLEELALALSNNNCAGFVSRYFPFGIDRANEILHFCGCKISMDHQRVYVDWDVSIGYLYMKSIDDVVWYCIELTGCNHIYSVIQAIQNGKTHITTSELRKTERGIVCSLPRGPDLRQYPLIARFVRVDCEITHVFGTSTSNTALICSKRYDVLEGLLTKQAMQS